MVVEMAPYKWYAFLYSVVVIRVDVTYLYLSTHLSVLDAQLNAGFLEKYKVLEVVLDKYQTVLLKYRVRYNTTATARHRREGTCPSFYWTSFFFDLIYLEHIMFTG